jgi:hypothetical protein
LPLQQVTATISASGEATVQEGEAVVDPGVAVDQIGIRSVID